MSRSNSFGAWLKARRAALDLTQKALAAQVHCAPITIRKIEKGDAKPSRELAALLAETLAIPPDERTQFVQWARDNSLTAPQTNDDKLNRHNLPFSLTRLIGREQEIAELSVLLRAPLPRLITVTGPGGVGKTRLVVETGYRLLKDLATPLGAFSDGVWLIDFTSVTDPARVVKQIAKILNVRVTEEHALLDTLTAELRTKRMLLIFDNCEAVADRCARSAEALLLCAPQLRILATSRETLGLSGERIFRVSPLPAPHPDSLVRAADLIAHVSKFDAVQLFLERAQDVRHDFGLDARNARAIAQIVWMLDGIPLAIELAAARVNMLSAEQLVARLQDRFQLLTLGGRTTIAHHQTLEALLDWSYELLSEPERILLRRLAVFVGGFELEAVERVCADADSKPETLELLNSLVNKSLVFEQTSDEASRFNLLETIRHYAARRLQEQNETDALSLRHLNYFLTLAKEGEVKIRSSEQTIWLDRFEREHDNLRHALAYALQNGHEPEALELAAALWLFWYWRDHFAEGRHWLDQALANAPKAPLPLRAKAMRAAGVMANMQNDDARGIALLQQALLLWRQTGDKNGIAGTLNSLGTILSEFHPEQAQPYLEESVALHRESNDQWGLTYALNNLGELARSRQDIERASVLYQECLELRRALGDERGIAVALHNLGYILLAQGQVEQALDFFREGPVRFRALGNRRGMTECLVGIAAVSAEQNKFLRAIRLLGAAEIWLKTFSGPLMPADQIEFERLVTICQERLDDQRFGAAWAMGQDLPLEKASALAMGIRIRNPKPLTWSTTAPPDTPFPKNSPILLH